MKIGDAPKSVGSLKSGRTRGATGVRAESATATGDQILIAGVPEAEMTPKVREALTSLMNEVQALRAELEETRERMGELERLADRDPLLDVYNRRAFVRELDRAMAMMDRYNMKASLVFIDLNDLKKINDRLGHGAGDAALAHISHVVFANVRQADILGRLGGDEFGLLLMQADQEAAEKKAAELTHAVSARPVEWKGAPFTAHVSCGVVEIIKGQSADETMERADNAMYEVKGKKNGSN